MRLDHVVIAVRDLRDAGARFTTTGFDVRPGGRHIGFGTENAIIRFGLEYVELITVTDAAAARRASTRSKELAGFLERHASGYVGYALATDDLDDVALRLRAIGVECEGPTSMRRQRPDGSILEWTLLIPGGVAWRRPWPFFISWGRPDAERLAEEPIGVHASGATAISGLSVAVDDLPAAGRMYRAILGEPVRAWATSLRFAIAGTAIDLFGPDDPAARGLERGPGPFALRLRGTWPSGTSVTREPMPSVAVTFE